VTPKSGSYTDTNACNWHIGGCFEGLEDGAFKGAIDDVRIYDRPLSTAEITAMVPTPSPQWHYNPATGTYYRLTDIHGTWNEAEAEAVQRGGHLVTINDVAEQQWLQDVFGGEGQLWTGFTDREEEGHWKWVAGDGGEWFADGHGTSYVNWRPGEPNSGYTNAPDEDYGTFNSYWWSNGQWADYQVYYPTQMFESQGIIESNVPEPATLSILALGVSALRRQRKV